MSITQQEWDKFTDLHKRISRTLSYLEDELRETKDALEDIFMFVDRLGVEEED